MLPRGMRCDSSSTPRSSSFGFWARHLGGLDFRSPACYGDAIDRKTTPCDAGGYWAAPGPLPALAGLGAPGGEARCAALREAWGVEPRYAWGKMAPGKLREEWRALGCDGYQY